MIWAPPISLAVPPATDTGGHAASCPVCVCLHVPPSGSAFLPYTLGPKLRMAQGGTSTAGRAQVSDGDEARPGQTPLQILVNGVAEGCGHHN